MQFADIDTNQYDKSNRVIHRDIKMIVNLTSWMRFAIIFCNKIILQTECDNIVFDKRFNHAFKFYHALIALLLIIKFNIYFCRLL